ncbi:hypothetical protein GR28A_00166 [Vibrio phage vB_VcorM_GR28A]|nr:hypothetical protein GR28A_00166 [Vibrio phage vB_VcorM_GR28A]
MTAIVGVPIGGTIGWLGHLTNPPKPIPANFKPNNAYDFTMELRSSLATKTTDSFNVEGDYFYRGANSNLGKVAPNTEMTLELKHIPSNVLPSSGVKFKIPAFTVPKDRISKLQSFIKEKQVVYRISQDGAWVESGKTAADLTWRVYASAAKQPGNNNDHGYYLAPTTEDSDDWNNGDQADWFGNTNADRRFYGQSKDWTQQRLDNDTHGHADQDIDHTHNFGSMKVSVDYQLKNTTDAKDGSWTRGGAAQTKIDYTPTPYRYARMMMITRIW